MDHSHVQPGEQAFAQLFLRLEVAVVWGRIVAWVDAQSGVALRQEFYDEDGEKLRLLRFDDVREEDGRLVPHRWTLTPLDKEGHETRIELLEIDFEVTSTGKTETHLVESLLGKLTPAQIDRARTKLAALNIHPREALANATALARAEARYVELTGAAREDLGEAIATFRAALEAEDQELISAMHGRLLELTGSEMDDDER